MKARWINHACNASLDVAFETMDTNFVLPGMPWAACVRSAYAIAARDIRKGEELTANYESFPPYMMRSITGVAACASMDNLQQHDEDHVEL